MEGTGRAELRRKRGERKKEKKGNVNVRRSWERERGIDFKSERNAPSGTREESLRGSRPEEKWVSKMKCKKENKQQNGTKELKGKKGSPTARSSKTDKIERIRRCQR